MFDWWFNWKDICFTPEITESCVQSTLCVSFSYGFPREQHICQHWFCQTVKFEKLRMRLRQPFPLQCTNQPEWASLWCIIIDISNMSHWWLQCNIDKIICWHSVNKIYMPTLHCYDVYIPFHSSPACPFLRWLCVKRSLTKWNISFKNRSNWSILQYFKVGQCLAFAKQGQGKWSSPGLSLQQKSQPVSKPDSKARNWKFVGPIIEK